MPSPSVLFGFIKHPARRPARRRRSGRVACVRHRLFGLCRLGGVHGVRLSDRAGAAAGFDADMVIAGEGRVGAFSALRRGVTGARGALHERLGPQPPARRCGPRFAMGDSPDATGWGDTAHLFFTPFGSLESFPLPENRRHWVARLRPGDEETDGAAALDAAIHRIAGVPGRTGAWIVALRSEADPSAALRAYERERRNAFRCVAVRSARGMWLGTRNGPAASAWRSLFIRGLLRPPSLQPRLARYFSMLGLPDATARRRGRPMPAEVAA